MIRFCNYIAWSLIFEKPNSLRIIKIKKVWSLSHVLIYIFSFNLEYEESVFIYLSWALLPYLSFTYPYQKQYIKSLLRPRTDALTIMGLLRVIVAFSICASTSVF